ncbi:MAG: hypothetical protein ABR591_13100 [Candidatus Velthaea sp.]
MIAPLLFTAAIAVPPVAAPPVLGPPAILQRYAAALKALREPAVLSFDYTLEQTGRRTLVQTHRVFRSGGNERDETLVVDGRNSPRPIVRIFRGRRNRYTVAALAPRPEQYAFSYVGSRRDGHHVDYVFRLTPKKPAPFVETQVTIDGVRFLPNDVTFATREHDGSGTVLFGARGTWWVATAATARARVANVPSSENLTFRAYRFPPALPPSTFSQPRPLPTGKASRK